MSNERRSHSRRRASCSCCENFPKRRNLHLNASREGGREGERVIKLDCAGNPNRISTDFASVVTPWIPSPLWRPVPPPLARWRSRGSRGIDVGSRVGMILTSQSASLPPSLHALSVKSVFLTRPSSAAPLPPPPPPPPLAIPATNYPARVAVIDRL